jgi:hypothetical protein
LEEEGVSYLENNEGYYLTIRRKKESSLNSRTAPDPLKEWKKMAGT